MVLLLLDWRFMGVCEVGFLRRSVRGFIDCITCVYLERFMSRASCLAK